MTPEPIVVEPDEEVNGVVARLRGAPGVEVPIEIPSRSRFAASRFSFVLLNRCADLLGKRVIVTSDDPAVERLAARNGFGGEEPEAAVPQSRALEVRPAELGEDGSRLPAPVGKAVARAEVAITWLTSLERLPAMARRRFRVGLYAGAIGILVVGTLAMVVVMPSAKVTLVANAKPFQSDVTVTADQSGGPIRVRVVSVTRQAAMGFKTMGEKVVAGAVAKGTVTFDAGGCPGPGLLIPNGTRLRGPNGVEFATVSGDLQLDPNNNTQADSDILATQPGTSGNVDTGKYAFENPGAGHCIKIAGNGGTSGGVDEQKSIAITTSDIVNARNTLEQALRQQIYDEVLKDLRPGEKLDASQIVYESPDLNTDRKVDDPSPNFSASMILKAEATYYNATDVADAFGRAVSNQLPAADQLAGKVDARYDVTAASGGHLTFTGRASGWTAPRIELETIKSHLAGVPTGQAESSLRQLPVQSVSIQQFPLPFPLMPFSGSRIDVEYVVATGAPPSAGG
jgi:hypothetical protein